MTALTVNRYERRGGNIIATQVSTSNYAEIATWTGGTTHPHTRTHATSVSVPGLVRPVFAGEWVVRFPDGRFKVLDDLDFHDRYQRSS